MDNTHKETNEADFEKDISKGYVFVDFWASWCNQCHSLSTRISDFRDKYGLTMLTVDCGKYWKLASRLGVMSLPTMILFQDGKEVSRAYSFDIISFLIDNKDKK